MDPGSKSPVRLALKILSAQFRQSTGEVVTNADIEEIRSWVGEDGETMSARDAACLVIRRALTDAGRQTEDPQLPSRRPS